MTSVSFEKKIDKAPCYKTGKRTYYNIDFGNCFTCPDLSGTINQYHVSDELRYQVVIQYGINWLCEKKFDSLPKAQKWVAANSSYIKDICKTIHKEVFYYECELVERYKARLQ